MIKKLRIILSRLFRKQMCWNHTSYTVSCETCKEIVK
jgi:hypothetical protein